MFVYVIRALVLLALTSPSFAQGRGGASSDPLILLDNRGYNNTSSLSLVSESINTSLKTLVLIMAGQSQCTSINPTLYTPTSSTVIYNFNIGDGAAYSIGGPLLGAQSAPLAGGVGGPGNVAARLAQLFITNNRFDQVFLIPTCIGSTLAADWATGLEKDRIPVAIRRAISRGITPTTTGVTFAISWWQGESDGFFGTSSASYQASMATILSNAQASGFTCANCRFFVNVETWDMGNVYSTIQGAQSAIINSTTFFAGGNLDTLNASNRQSDNTHFNDTGAASAATLVYNAMHASGAPF